MIRTGVAAAGTASTNLLTVPPGPCTLLLSNPGPGTVFVGDGTAVTTANGFGIPPGVPVAFPCYQASLGGQMSCVSSSGTISLAWLLSSAQ